MRSLTEHSYLPEPVPLALTRVNQVLPFRPQQFNQQFQIITLEEHIAV
jgi:hypothetical protein